MRTEMIAYLVLLAATPIFGVPVKDSQAHIIFEGKPFQQTSHPNIQHYTSGTSSAVVEVPLTPDAVVYPNSEYRATQNTYVAEPIPVLPVPGPLRATSAAGYPLEYGNALRILHYLPKSYYSAGYRLPIQQGQPFGGAGSSVAGETVTAEITQGQTVFARDEPAGDRPLKNPQSVNEPLSDLFTFDTPSNK